MFLGLSNTEVNIGLICRQLDLKGNEHTCMNFWHRVERDTSSNVFEEAGTSNYRGAYKMTFSNRDIEPAAYNIRKLCASTGFEANVPKVCFRFNDIVLSSVLSWCY